MLRLVVAGHDYASILKHWTLPMVLKVNEAMDLQEDANRLSMESTQPKKEGLNGIW